MSKPSQISLCNENDRLPDGKIRLCKEDKENDGKIKLCEEKEVDPCLAYPLWISGSGAPEEGDGYTCGGGVPPYRWSASAGTLESDGSEAWFTDLSGACGMGTIVVTDSCGRSAIKTVRFPSGQWVLTSTEEGPCGDFSTLGGCWGVNTCSVISGGSKTTYITGIYWCMWPIGTEGCMGQNSIYPTHPCGWETRPAGYNPGGMYYLCVIKRINYYSWSCP